MADAKTKQAIKLFDGTNERGVALAYPIYVGISDGVEVANVNALNQLEVEIKNASIVVSDGGNAISIDDGAGSITVDGSVGISGSVTVIATDLDIRDIDKAQDDILIYCNTVKDGTGTSYIPLVDADGHLQTDILSIPTVNVDITAQTLATVKISKDASVNSAGNPIFVSEVEAAITGEVHDYNTASVVVKDGIDNHDYTVNAAKTLLLWSVIASSSGAGKYEVQVGPVASLATKAVKFGSQSNSNVVFTFDPPIEVPDTATGTVRVIRRNDDNQSLDMYSTIIGNEV